MVLLVRARLYEHACGVCRAVCAVRCAPCGVRRAVCLCCTVLTEHNGVVEDVQEADLVASGREEGLGDGLGQSPRDCLEEGLGEGSGKGFGKGRARREVR